MRKQVARSKIGFTLVELLVVIAIIAVLVSLLLPALVRAREQAVALKCANNLRQVVIAMSNYESEYNSYPFLRDVSYGTYLWYGRQQPRTWVDALTGVVGPRYLAGTNIPGGDLGVLACPSVERYEKTYPIFLDYQPHYGYNINVNPPRELWFYNTHGNNAAPYYFFGKRSRMRKDSARMVLLAETSQGTGTAVNGKIDKYRGTGGSYGIYGTWWDQAIGPFIDLRHGRGQAVNVAFFAGNVELVYPPLRSPTSYYDDHPFAPSRFNYEP